MIINLSLNPKTPADGYWDQTLLRDLLKGYKVGNQWFGVTNGVVVVLPGKGNANLINQIDNLLKDSPKILLFITSDEESSFDWEKLTHQNIKIWVQTPNRHTDYTLPVGYTPHARDYKGIVPFKGYDWNFQGQVTHIQRQRAYEAIRELQNGFLHITQGFAQGLDPQEYCKNIARSKVTICPSGPVTPDTFRLYEALELGSVPIVEETTGQGKVYKDFFVNLFKSIVPFPVINDWEHVAGHIRETVEQYPKINNRVQAFWYRHKHHMKDQIVQQIQETTGEKPKEDITVVIPTSPIIFHPNTVVIDETIASVRHHLPNAKIIVTFDGVRHEQEYKRADYEEYIRRVLWNHRDIYPVIFEENTLQVGMMRAVMEQIKTPYLLYVEHDTPLVIDKPISFNSIKQKMASGITNLVRFHFEAFVPKDHEHMMLGKEGTFIRTCQWSQRPHIVTKAYYERVLGYFSDNAKTMIEDKMHSVLHEDYLKHGMQGWNQHRVHIYAPTRDIKYSYNLDGRQGEPKYDDQYTF